MRILKQAEQNPKGSQIVLTPRQEELVREISERLRSEIDGELNADNMTRALQEYIRMKNEAGGDWSDH